MWLVDSLIEPTDRTDRYSARTAMGSERPHTRWFRFTATVGRGADEARELRFRRTPTSPDRRRRNPTTVRGLSGPSGPHNRCGGDSTATRTRRHHRGTLL